MSELAKLIVNDVLHEMCMSRYPGISDELAATLDHGRDRGRELFSNLVTIVTKRLDEGNRQKRGRPELSASPADDDFLGGALLGM